MRLVFTHSPLENPLRMGASPARRGDSRYPQSAARLYGQIGQRLKGLLWKDGGLGVKITPVYKLGVRL